MDRCIYFLIRFLGYRRITIIHLGASFIRLFAPKFYKKLAHVFFMLPVCTKKSRMSINVVHTSTELININRFDFWALLISPCDQIF